MVAPLGQLGRDGHPPKGRFGAPVAQASEGRIHSKSRQGVGWQLGQVGSQHLCGQAAQLLGQVGQ